MALRVRVADQRKKKKVVLSDRDFRVPGERQMFMTAMVAVLLGSLLPAGIAAGIVFRPDQEGPPFWQIPVILAAWPLVVLIIVPAASAAPVKKKLKAMGIRAKVMGNNYPEILQLVRSHCKVLGMKEPDVFVVDDEVPTIWTLAGGKGSIIITKPVLTALAPDELSSAIAHELGHLKAGHVRLNTVITYLLGAKPIVKALCWPGIILNIALARWATVIEWTADRVALLLTGKASTVNTAIIKMAVEADRLAEIDSAELKEYIGGSGELSSDSAQVERHFRIGKFITDQPGLRERVTQLAEYAKSDEAKEAFGKVA
ncbi:MAG: M48 family metalloprotease, partial [Armatimonadota bacterium]